jgi:hypothetical protein
MPAQQIQIPASPAPRERNPKVAAKHRHEVALQITIPVVIGCVLVLALSIIVVFASDAATSRWADISLIWLIIPSLLVSFICMAVLAGLVYLTIWVITNLPFLFFRIHSMFLVVQTGVQKTTDRMTAPFIRFGAFKASTRTASRNLTKSLKPTRRAVKTAQPGNKK